MSRIILSLLLLCLVTSQARASSVFTFQHYDVENSRLFMRLVTPTIQGDVLLKVDEKMQPLKGASLEGLFTLTVPVPCERLSGGATLYWATAGHALLSASIPPQSCQIVPKLVPITIFDKQGECWLDIGDNTLWRAATEVSKLNKATVYQNMYALFVVNRTSFSGEDINRLKNSLLRCPPDRLIKQIQAKDAYRLFKEMLEFKKSNLHE